MGEGVYQSTLTNSEHTFKISAVQLVDAFLYNSSLT